MLFKRRCSSIIISFSIVSTLGAFSIEPHIKFIASPKLKDYKLVASLPSENISLLAQSNKSKGIYNKFILITNEKTAVLDWENVTSPTFLPKLLLSDVNKDCNRELIVILTTGTGSDLHVENIHILQLPSLKEINIFNPINIINENVNTKIISKNDNKVLITISINNNITEVVKDKSFTPLWFNNVAFGSEVHWRIYNDIIYADVDAQVSPSGYVGTIEIEYEFKGDVLTSKRIRFV
jgi:hypothetical protein